MELLSGAPKAHRSSTEQSRTRGRRRRPRAKGGRQFLVRLDELTAGLAGRRGVLALWIVSTAAVAVVALLMHWAALPGWDDAAHVYKVYLLRTGQGVFWDNAWYGGGYGAITYGVLFYWLAQFIPAKLIVVVAAGAVPVLYYIYQRDMWKIADPLPAWLFAGVMAVYLAHGQDPFVLALALTLGGLALLARDHPVLAALPVAVGIFANPLAFVVCGVFMLADVLARPRVRRRYCVFFATVAPFVAARVMLGWAFGEPSRYLNETSELLLYLGFALAGAALAGLNAAHRRRPLVILFLTYAFVCVASFVMPGSAIGNNIGRFFFVFCLPLLFLLRHSRLRRPFPLGRHGDDRGAGVRGAAVQRALQPLHHGGGAAAVAGAVLRARAHGRSPALRPQLPLPRRGPAPALGGLLLPARRLRHNARLVPPGGRHPQRPVLHRLRRAHVRRLAALHGREVHLRTAHRGRRLEPARSAHPAQLARFRARRAGRRLDHLPAARRAAHRHRPGRARQRRRDAHGPPEHGLHPEHRRAATS